MALESTISLMGVSIKVSGKTMKCMVSGYLTTVMASSTKDNMKKTKSEDSASFLGEIRKSTRAGLSMVRGTVYLYRRISLRTSKSRVFSNLETKLCGSTNKQLT